ncbi:MAG: site-2 protease family protein [Bacteroidota bacterium]|nr:site-2 protease family protein [Bacteroidota bacterium]
MSDGFGESYYSMDLQKESTLEKKNLLIHILLFLITFVTTTLAGMEWTTGAFGPYKLGSLLIGLPYSFSILFILASHEFGHYFAAKYHKVKATLPYFIPLPSFSGLFLNFGTMGAVIRTKTIIPSNKAMFDIGVSGPIAGFIASLIVLCYGFTHLPGPEYILAIHPDYFSPAYGKNGIFLAFGDTMLFSFLRDLLTTKAQFVPPMSEVYHYPFLCVGWFGLFVTSMNMIPVGQLDGGHIVYSMFGPAKHNIIAKVSMGVLLVLGLLGIGDLVFNWNLNIGWVGWLFWGLILLFVIKVKHPPVMEFYKLDKKRMIIGYLSLFILFLSFSPSPIK